MLILIKSISEFVHRNIPRENLDELPRSPSGETLREENGIRNVTLGRAPAVVARVTALFQRGAAKLTQVNPKVLRRVEKNFGSSCTDLVEQPAAALEHKTSAFVTLLMIIGLIVVNTFFLAVAIVPLLLSVGYKF